MRSVLVLIGGMVFGLGLALGGMTEPEVVLDFLRLEDLGLLVLMGAAVGVTTLAYQLGPRLLSRPAVGSFERHHASLSRRTVVGAVLFGVGWGVSGTCPGAALASVGVGNHPILIAIAAMFAGAYVQGRFFEADVPTEPASPASRS